MTIRSKLAWTLILLLIFGITAISSYSIVFIKDYLISEGQRDLSSDTRWLAVTIENLPDGEAFQTQFEQVAQTSGYELAVYNVEGELLAIHPDTVEADPYLSSEMMISLETRGSTPLMPDNSNSEKITSFSYLAESTNRAEFIRVSQLKDDIYEPITTIRWIIYYGMFISIGIVILVSLWIARNLTRPITQIKNAAQNIAGGDVDQQIDLQRNDEYGALADSLNQMATKLREDTEQIKRFAEKQRQFFADITHEIRNPLHTISASLEMIELDNLSEEKRQKYLKNAQKQVDRIGRLYQDLLTLQRYDSDDRFIEKQTFDLAEIGRHMIEWYGDKAHEKGITLDVNTHSCKAVGDPGKIEQVVDNLISNAVKYTNEGTITLSYGKSMDYETKQEKVQITVQDSGIGISEEHLDRLFDRFYRTDKARSRDKGGTGLGLAVVKSILDAHESDIEVSSQKGKGTTFSFSLPAE